MPRQSYNGDWFLPNGKRYPGALDIDKENGRILLEIYSSESIEGFSITLSNYNQSYFHRYILGDAAGGSYTLYNCKLGKCSIIGKDFYKTEYHAEYMINEAYISNPDGLMVRSGKFLFPNLASWYDGWHHMSKLRDIKGNLTEIRKLETETLKVDDELELIFIDSIYSRIKEMNVSYTLDYNKYLAFNYATDVPFSRLLTDSFTFLNLLSFSHGRPLQHKIISVDISHKYTDQPKDSWDNKQDFNRYSIANFSLDQNKEIPRQGAHQNNMILSGWKLSKDELNKIIIKWFSNKNYFNIIEYYLDSNNWFQDIKDAGLSNVMFNNRFLNLIQGLEDVYRESYSTEKTLADETEFNDKKRLILNDITDGKLKQWLNNTFKFTRHPRLEEKLSTLTNALLPLIIELFGEISFDNFPVSAKDFRHKLSHGMNKETNLGDELHLDFYIGKLLLLLSIIHTLEINDIKRLLKGHHELERNIREIHALQQITSKKSQSHGNDNG